MRFQLAFASQAGCMCRLDRSHRTDRSYRFFFAANSEQHLLRVHAARFFKLSNLSKAARWLHYLSGDALKSGNSQCACASSLPDCASQNGCLCRLDRSHRTDRSHRFYSLLTLKCRYFMCMQSIALCQPTYSKQLGVADFLGAINEGQPMRKFIITNTPKAADSFPTCQGMP